MNFLLSGTLQARFPGYLEKKMQQPIGKIGPTGQDIQVSLLWSNRGVLIIGVVHSYISKCLCYQFWGFPHFNSLGETVTVSFNPYPNPQQREKLSRAIK